MIKSGQIEELAKAGFHYITAITKPQIDTLLSGGVLQMALFDDSLCEVRAGERALRAAAQPGASRGNRRHASWQTSQRGRTAPGAQPVSRRACQGQSERGGEKVRAKIARLKSAAWLRVGRREAGKIASARHRLRIPTKKIAIRTEDD